MAIYEINATERTQAGKGGAHKVRGTGKIPAVAYGQGLASAVPISLNDAEFRDFLRHHNASTALVRLNMENAGTLADKVFIIKDLQIHVLSLKPMSVDLQAIDMNKPVTLTVPIVFEGVAKGIKFGGVVTPLIRELEISCLPMNIPQAFHVDVTELDAEQTLYVSEIKVGEGLAVVTPANTPLVACAIQRVAVVAEPTVEAVAAEGAEGAPAAEGAAKPDAKAAPGTAPKAAPGAAPKAADKPAAGGKGESKK